MALYNDKRMTVREVAEILGVQEQLVRKHTRELYPDLMENGVATYLNEKQITAIKQKMRPVTLVTGAITDIEAAEKTNLRKNSEVLTVPKVNLETYDFKHRNSIAIRY